MLRVKRLQANAHTRSRTGDIKGTKSDVLVELSNFGVVARK